MSDYDGRRTIAAPVEPPDRGLWWADKSQAEFYAFSKVRTQELCVRYGSGPVSTTGPQEPGFNERARRVVKAQRSAWSS